MARLQEAGSKHKVSRLTADDSFIPLAKAAYYVLPSVEGIVEKARELMGTGK